MPSPAARRSVRSAAHVSAARLLAASCLAVGGFLACWSITGCDSDTERADKDVQRNIKAAQSERGESAVQKGFQKAAAVKNASPTASINAKVLLARAQVEQARQILRGVAQDDLTIARRAALTLLADTLDAGAPSAEASRSALSILAEELATLARLIGELDTIVSRLQADVDDLLMGAPDDEPA